MKRILKAFSGRQGGFTLVELLIVISIVAVLAIGAAATFINIIVGHAENQNSMTTIRQVQQIGHRMSQDMLMADIIDTGTYPGATAGFDILTIYWSQFTSWNGEEWTSVKHKIVYNVTQNELVRYHFVDSLTTDLLPHAGGYPDRDSVDWMEAPAPNGSELLVAQEVESINVTLAGSQYVLTVTSSVEGFQSVTETKVFDVKPRPVS